MNREQLIALVESRTFAPFAWGKNDCAVNFADFCKAMGAPDPAKGLRGYRSAAAGLKRLKKAGYKSVTDLVDDKLTLIDASQARDFDFAIINQDQAAKELAPMISPAILIGSMLYGIDQNGPVIQSRSGAVRWYTANRVVI